MIIKDIVDENYQDYKKPSMFIATSLCSWKCKDADGNCLCQNLKLATQPCVAIDDSAIVKRYLRNDLTHAVVIGGLEPFDQYEELLSLVKEFRKSTQDDIVIYTGYTEDEIDASRIKQLCCGSGALIIKFGRFVADGTAKYDDVLGITLASSNQYGKIV